MLMEEGMKSNLSHHLSDGLLRLCLTPLNLGRFSENLGPQCLSPSIDRGGLEVPDFSLGITIPIVFLASQLPHQACTISSFWNWSLR